MTTIILAFNEADYDHTDIHHTLASHLDRAAEQARLWLDQRQAGKVTMQLHDAAFDYLKPTDEQADIMAEARVAAKEYAHTLDELLLDGPDKTYILRKIREIAMWVNVAITREADGSPRIQI